MFILLCIYLFENCILMIVIMVVFLWILLIGILELIFNEYLCKGYYKKKWKVLIKSLYLNVLNIYFFINMIFGLLMF